MTQPLGDGPRAGRTCRIRVAEVIDEAAVGGGQRHVLDLAGRLDRADFEVAVLCEERGWLVDELARRGEAVRPIRIQNRPDPRAWREVERRLREFGADLVHTHGGTAGFHGRLAARRLGLPAVHTYHGLHSLRDSGPRAALFRAIDRLLASRTDRLICVSDGDLALAGRYGLAPADRSLVVPNGIDVTVYAEARRRRAARPAGGFVIGTVGRLSPEKGHLDLIEAAGLVCVKAPQARFVVVGEGGERHRLEARRNELGLEGSIELPGARYDMVEVLAAFDLFVLPSWWEGHPIAVLEALASGLAVVASDIDGVRAIRGDSGAVILVPPRDPVALAAALLGLISDPVRREAAAQAGDAELLARFDVATTVRTLASVYRSVLAARNRI